LGHRTTQKTDRILNSDEGEKARNAEEDKTQKMIKKSLKGVPSVKGQKSYGMQEKIVKKRNIERKRLEGAGQTYGQNPGIK